MKDTLYLLKGSFQDPRLGSAPYHCAACAQIEGLLSYSPQLRGLLDVVYLDFARPRDALVERLGEAHQSCPVLVPAEPVPVDAAYVSWAENGRQFIAGAAGIATYLGARFGISTPHP